MATIIKRKKRILLFTTTPMRTVRQSKSGKHGIPRRRL